MWGSVVFCVCFCLPLGYASDVSNEDFDAKDFFVHPVDRNDSGITSRIIGGQEVTANSYPSQVALLMEVGNSLFFCGGSLISNQWVLTAAHCLYKNPSNIGVVLGSHNLNITESTRVTYTTTQYVYHSGWDENTFQNDVGLVRLPEEVPFNKYIKPAPLASGSNKYEGSGGVIVGWGATVTDGDVSNVLKSVDSTIMTNTACSAASSEYKQLIKSMHLCTSGAGIVGSCNGDSGGPVFVDGIQVGIVSFGPKNCQTGLPSVFARVTTFHDWITQHTNDGAVIFNNAKLSVMVLATFWLVHLLK